MSTKTTIKRIALVAAAALALGGFSAVSANAAADFTVSVTGRAGTAPAYTLAAVTGTYPQITVNGASDNTISISSTGVGSLYYPASPAQSVISTSLGSSNAFWYASTGGLTPPGSKTFDSGVATADLVISAFSAVAGTQVVTFTGNVTGSITLTITWGAATGSIYAKTVNTMTPLAGVGTYAYTDLDGNQSVTADASDLTNGVASILVEQVDAAGILMDPAYTKAVVVTIAGVGTLSTNGFATPVAPYQAVAAKSANSAEFQVFADGRAGKANVTVSVGGVATDTFSINFFGEVASYSTTINHAYIKVGEDTAKVFTTKALDSLGSVVPMADINVKSSDSTIASPFDANPITTASAGGVTASGAQWAALGTVDSKVTASKKGKVTFTVTDSLTAPTVSKTADFQVSGASITSLTMAFSAATYATGEAGKLTFTLKDSDGNPVGDGTYLINDDALAPIKSNVLILNSLNTTAVTVGTTITSTSGAASYSFFAPTSPTDLVFAGTLGTGPALASALRGTAVTTTAAVTSAAVDAAGLAEAAANAATDAANDAYSEAQNATQAATDALTAVSALAKQVKSLIASVKKLTAAVAKMKK